MLVSVYFTPFWKMADLQEFCIDTAEIRSVARWGCWENKPGRYWLQRTVGKVLNYNLF